MASAFAAEVNRIQHDALFARVLLELRYRLVHRFGICLGVYAFTLGSECQANAMHRDLLAAGDYDRTAGLRFTDILAAPLPPSLRIEDYQHF